MKRFVSAFVLLLAFSVQLLWGVEEGRFMRYPNIYKDKIVFTYENDLWVVSSQGGTATRLTSAPGAEYSARFSPDGKTIAFTGSYDGSPSVYTMPAEGGAPTRITYNPGGGQAIGWMPDGQKIVFRSYWENFIGRDPNLYFVNKDGGPLERFPIDRGTLCSFAPDGKKMLYNRKGNEEYYWKRYKGGQYCDIWMYDFDTKQFTPISNYVGKNAYPMWIGGKMYFVSDRGNGISNIYIEDLASRQITSATTYDDFDVMTPSTDGEQIVYMQNGYINVLDARSGKSTKLTVIIPSDRWALRNRTINPKEYVHFMNIANDGKMAILEARGDIFTVPMGKGQATNLSNTPGTREMYPQISPDGKWIAFFSDKTGEYQLYMQKVEGGEWTPLTTSLERFVYHLAWSPDGKKILFGNKDYSIFVLDVATKKLTKVDEWNQMKNDEFYWEVSDYNWSPDSRWVCYSIVKYNRNSQIFLYNLDVGKKYPVTDEFFDNLYPSFDADGKYLYYVSSRNFSLTMDFYEDDHVVATPQQVMVVQLRDGEKPPFAENPDTEVKEKKEKGAAEPFRIDIEGIQKRTFPLPVQPGNYFFLKAGKGKVAWCSVPKFTEAEYEEIFKPGGDTKWDLHVFDMSDKKEVTLPDKIRSFEISSNGENMIISAGSDIYTTTFDKAFSAKNFGEKLSLDLLVYTVDNMKEWNQIFTDAWRWYRDFFYDKNFHGHDWKVMGEKYRAYIPYLSSRDDLNWILSQMVGELCVSHTYVGGGDVGVTPSPPSSPVSTGWLGADLVPDEEAGYYKLAKIYGPTDLNLSLVGPLVRPDIDVKEGDYLLAINGTELKVPDDYFKLLQVTPGKKVSVTVNSKPTMTGAKTFEVEPVRNDQALRYYHWIDENIKKVEKASNGRLGYMHINAMGAGGIGEFDKYWRAYRYRDGIIVDVRRNSGGWTEYFLIDKLERKMTTKNVLRDMVPFRYPGSVGNGNYVAISNEYNGSDGEAFIEDWKANNLGPVVGVPSWGGLVGILNAQKTIDNGTVNQSNNAFYNKEGKWLVENHGADPTILQDNDPASVMAGHDLQLEKAIEVALKQADEHPFRFPPVPAYPKK